MKHTNKLRAKTSALLLQSVLVRIVTGVLEPIELAYVDRNLRGLERYSITFYLFHFGGKFLSLYSLLFHCCAYYLIAAHYVSSAVLIQQAKEDMHTS
jgi:hypothetical protein